MKKVSRGILLLMLLSAEIYGQKNRLVFMEGGWNAGLQGAGFLSGASVAAGLELSARNSVQIGAGEYYNFRHKSMSGQITFAYRHYWSPNFYTMAGFTHLHRISQDDFLKEPLEASLGSSKQITHLSGLTAGAGWRFNSIAKRGFGSHVFPQVSASVSLLAAERTTETILNSSFGLMVRF